jgi:hypothetical protein
MGIRLLEAFLGLCSQYLLHGMACCVSAPNDVTVLKTGEVEQSEVRPRSNNMVAGRNRIAVAVATHWRLPDINKVTS